MKYVLSVFVCFVLWSCSSPGPSNGDKPKIGSMYISSGVEAYFLGNLPFWANFSSWASCHREDQIRYMNFESISNSFDIKYKQIVHLQHMWNRKVSAFRKSTGQSEIPLKEEAFIFNNVYAQVIGGSFDFMPPNFKKISVIWVDPFLATPKKIKKILDMSKVQRGYPVLLSHCKTAIEMEELVQQLDLDEYGVKILSAEMFSIYNSKVKRTYDFVIDISELLPGKEITLYAPEFPKQIQGIYHKEEIK